MSEDAHQYEAAAEHLLRLLYGAVSHPGTFTLEDLPDWLRMAADERDRQGDFGAARLLDEWANRVATPIEQWKGRS